MIIGFDAKRAFQNQTGLGNYSRMLICGLAQQYQNVRSFLYAPDMSGEYKSYFSGYANISTRQPSGIDRHMPTLWRRYGVTFHLKGDKVDISGTSKGHGFQGVVKRHGQGRGRMTHGSHFHRAPGSMSALSCGATRSTIRHSTVAYTAQNSVMPAA